MTIKNKLSLLFMLLANISLFSIDYDQFYIWQKMYATKLKTAVLNDHKTTPLPQKLFHNIKDAHCEVENISPPTQEDSNYYLSSALTAHSHNETKIYTLFKVVQKKYPYEVSVMQMYSTDELHHMPSITLCRDVENNLYILTNQPPKGYRIHITTKKVHKNGNYLQEWTFYNETESLKEDIVFIPDGVGGTHIFFSDKSSRAGTDLNVAYEEGMKGVMGRLQENPTKRNLR